MHCLIKVVAFPKLEENLFYVERNVRQGKLRTYEKKFGTVKNDTYSSKFEGCILLRLAGGASPSLEFVDFRNLVIF